MGAPQAPKPSAAATRRRRLAFVTARARNHVAHTDLEVLDFVEDVVGAAGQLVAGELGILELVVEQRKKGGDASCGSARGFDDVVGQGTSGPPLEDFGDEFGMAGDELVGKVFELLDVNAGRA